VPVFPGDIVVGDAEGVVIIPQELADEIAEEAVNMTRFERFVADQVSEGRSITGLYPPTDPVTLERFEEWKKAGKG
jgi:regulator of RNase E activity RraA